MCIRDSIIRAYVALATLFGRCYTLATQREAVIAGERIYLNLSPALRHSLGRQLVGGIFSAIEPGAGAAIARGLGRSLIHPLRVRRSLDDQAHPDVAITLWNLGDNLTGQGRLEEAVPLLQESVDTHHQIYHGKHVGEAIANVGRLAHFDPWWIEEPTSPDDILGHAAIARAVAPIGVATGEHCHNRIMFKQLMQADAISFCQLDAARLGGVNEALAVLLLAAKFGVPVCPHAGGVGLCEYVQHLAMIDYIAISGSMEGRVVEYVDHLHEHFVDPVSVLGGRYLPPEVPGYSVEMWPESIAAYSYPHGLALIHISEPTRPY